MTEDLVITLKKICPLLCEILHVLEIKKKKTLCQKRAIILIAIMVRLK